MPFEVNSILKTGKAITDVHQHCLTGHSYVIVSEIAVTNPAPHRHMRTNTTTVFVEGKYQGLVSLLGRTISSTGHTLHDKS